MIKLENVSTRRFIVFLKKYIYEQKHYEVFAEYSNAIYLLEKYSVEDYQQLKELIESGNEDFNVELFKKELSRMEKKISQANKLGVEPELYVSNGYESSNIDEETLRFTDQATCGSVLLHKNPITLGSARTRLAAICPIAEIKYGLSHLNKNLKNIFRSTHSGATSERSKSVIEAINFYEKQVLRQAQEVQGMYSAFFPMNLFQLNKEQKRLIVESQLKDIVQYLLDNGDKYVWGDMTDTEKQKLVRLATNGKVNPIIRRNVIDVVSNYTTLTELEQDVVKRKTLDRFIVR